MNFWKNYRNTIVFAGLIIALIIVAILAGGDKKELKKEEVEVTEALEGEEVSAGVMTPIVDGEFTYSFDGINWDIVDIESEHVAETKVGFYFDNFTRYENGTVVVFGKPYFIGWYKGLCEASDSFVGEDFEDEDDFGTPISFVTCSEDESDITVGLFQKDSNIVAYQTTNDDPVLVRSIDMKTVVK